MIPPPEALSTPADCSTGLDRCHPERWPKLSYHLGRLLPSVPHDGAFRPPHGIGPAIAAVFGAAMLLSAASCGSAGNPTPSAPTPAIPRRAASGTSQSTAGGPVVPAITPMDPTPSLAAGRGSAVVAPTGRTATATPPAMSTGTQPASTATAVLAPAAAVPQPSTPTPVPPPAATVPPPTPTTAPAARTTQSWVDGPAELSRGQAAALQFSGDGARLSRGNEGYAATGELLSEVHQADFPFNNAVLSWNADAPAGTSLRFELRVVGDGGWSRWYTMGEWRADGGRSVSGQSDANGKVDIDTLKLNSTATALQYRVEFSSSSAANSPLLRQVSVVYADMRKGLAGPPLGRPAGAVRDLQVPGFSQLEQDPSVALKICSPTSLAMVLQYWGLNKSVPEVYTGVQDHTTGIYGDWPFNTAFAGANGFNARVDRFYSIEQLEREIAAGRPAIISISYSAGEITGAAAISTDGHLIVVRGFTPEGDVIVNDPVAPNSRSVRLVYRRDQLSRVWLRSGGIVYLVSPRS